MPTTENSNNPTYAQIISSVMPFFLSRGGEDFASPERILFYINCAIQDAFINDSPTFMYKVETIESFIVDGNHHRFETTYPILKSQECQGYTNTFDNSYIDMSPELLIIKCNDKYRFSGKQVLTHSDIQKIEIAYIRDYEWMNNILKLNEEVPLPRRYLPAIVKMVMDWASPINLTQSEAGTVDFFSHAINRLDKLAAQDSLTDVYGINK